MYKVGENTESVNNCLKISEDNREDARRTLEKLHHQGEQITRTHMMNADIEKDLSQEELKLDIYKLKKYKGGTEIGHLQVLQAIKDDNDKEHIFWPLWYNFAKVVEFDILMASSIRYNLFIAMLFLKLCYFLSTRKYLYLCY
ncbi:uncharacterized protein LOC122315348 [Carya illinoinensis]|uniref:Uncharacterized protein n=1 Tax=Carya illinoinensis TaxID=32201 RepID=A0A922EHR6_CARIL|nr:uncharacterized protein LOC122315348 [Carya illinoinensis]XP_042987150.1 uncharacterized protein LOC122315348 [Carya illinoinensis]XP_042987151.1 uncharacterized protein LOC122315348 [Carya illinoinensis]KAG6703164.1 hypothetical protein I3842_07G071600 [Carya illinoinensis]KAG6703165.1 hypothetical protein I3842_07G071600 [Carya illinoinensis]